MAEVLRFGGSRRFQDHFSPADRGNAKIYLPVVAESLNFEILALVDTGADWSVLAAEVAGVLGLFNRDGESLTLSTRLGNYSGTLERLRILIRADLGDSLEVDATFFVSEEWPAGTFLGYNGFLQHLLFAVDATENRLYFDC